MKNLVHPGLVVRDDCLEPLGLSVTASAKVLGVSRQTPNNVLNSKSGISPEMAIRLSKAFGRTAEDVVANAASQCRQRRVSTKAKSRFAACTSKNCTSADSLGLHFGVTPCPSSFRTIPLVPGSCPPKHRIIEVKPA